MDNVAWDSEEQSPLKEKFRRLEKGLDIHFLRLQFPWAYVLCMIYWVVVDVPG